MGLIFYFYSPEALLEKLIYTYIYIYFFVSEAEKERK